MLTEFNLDRQTLLLFFLPGIWMMKHHPERPGEIGELRNKVPVSLTDERKVPRRRRAAGHSPDTFPEDLG